MTRACPSRRPGRPRRRQLSLHLRRREYTGHRRRHPRLGPAGQRRAPGRRPASSWAAPAASWPPAPRNPTPLVQIEAPVPRADAPRHHRGAVRRPGGDRPARAGPAGRPSPTPPATTPCTSTATCSWSAPARPASAAARPRPAPAPGSCCWTTSPSSAGRCSAPPSGSTAARPWTGWPPPWPSSRPSPRSGSCSAPPPSATTTTATSSPSNGAPTTSASTAPAHLSRQRVWRIRARQVVAGHRRPRAPDGLRGQRPPRHHARRRGPHLPAPLRRAARPPGRGVHDQRQRLRRRRRPRAPPASRSPPSSTPARRRRALGAARASGAASRCAPGRSSPARAAASRVTAGARRRRWSTAGSGTAAGSPATCCWSPAAGTRPCTCYSQARGRLRYDDRLGAFVPGTDVDGVGVAGSARGRLHAGGSACATVPPWRGRPASGLRPRRAGAVDAGDRGRAGRAVAHAVVGARPGRAGLRQHAVRRPAARRDRRRHPARDRGGHALGGAHQALHDDRHRPRPGQDLRRHRLAASSPTPSACDIADLGTTTFRPPYTPVAFAALAGRDRGDLLRPDPGHRRSTSGTSRTAPGSRTSGSGSGPGTTRRPARTWQPPCCASARPPGSRWRIMDASTLGKIEVRGPGRRPVPRPRSTPTSISTLKVGAIRYGVMCGLDGMVFDDGTVMRLAEDRFLHHHDHRQRGDDPGLDGGVAADRVAGPAVRTAPR